MRRVLYEWLYKVVFEDAKLSYVMVRCDTPFFSPRPGSSPHAMETWLKKKVSNALLVFFFNLYVLDLYWWLSDIKHLAPKLLQQTIYGDHILPADPPSASCNSLSGRGLAWRMRKLASIRLVEARPPPVAAFPITHEHTLCSRSLRKTRGHVRLHSGFMWRLHFPNHVSKRINKLLLRCR